MSVFSLSVKMYSYVYGEKTESKITPFLLVCWQSAGIIIQFQFVISQCPNFTRHMSLYLEEWRGYLFYDEPNSPKKGV